MPTYKRQPTKTKERKFFTVKQAAAPLPDLIEVQKESYDWFFKEGIKELFEEISPITDFTGRDLELYFEDYYLDEPKFDEVVCREKNITYEAPLRVNAKLLNKRSGKIDKQEIYLGDVPVMTRRGTFVVNGIERTVVSQLIRSAGAFFTAENVRGRCYYGAKIIPNRGAWVEIETDQNNVLWIKVDRKRKVAATSLLRAFGYATNAEIIKLFAEVNNHPNIDYLDATLKKDLAHNEDEGLIEVYRRIRPGDLATADNARSLIQSMFFNFDRYDLGRVGVYKFNTKFDLGLEKKDYDAKEHRVLSPEKLLLVLKEIVRLNVTQEEPDDIDHLGNRRIRAVGELVQNRFRVGLARMERIIKDRMSTYELDNLAPNKLINARPVIGAVREFFMSSQLSQFMDQVNPLAELEHKRRVSALGPGGLSRDRAGFEVRDVHTTHYGRICPIATPEGPNIGLVGHMASYAKVNSFGFLETPYRKVVKEKDGRTKVTNEIVYLNSFQEERSVTVSATTPVDKDGYFLTERVAARIKGEPGVIASNRVDYMDVASSQILSMATSSVPFLEHNDATRALMGSNMQRQAVPCIQTDSPIVGTGMEKAAAENSGYVVLAEAAGEVTHVDGQRIEVTPARGEKQVVRLNKFIRSNASSCVNQKPLVNLGQKVKKGEALCDGPSIQNGELALGQNVLVAYMVWDGFNYEDAVIISERLVQADKYTSIHIENYTIDVRETKLGPEVVTSDIPNVSEEKLKNLDSEGVVRIGAEVQSGDILVGKITPKGETELSPEERLLRAIFGEKARDVRDSSLYLEHGEHGKVIDVKVFSAEAGDKLQPGVITQVQVTVADMRKIQVGDKMAGRHGNKGVISRVVPVADMPYLEDGTPVDIILSPLGVISRMNLGQLLETHLGLAANALGYKCATPALDGVTEEEIKAELVKAGFSTDGQAQLYDGRTGEPFDHQTTVGYNYMLKLNHMVEDKIHQRSIGPYSLITQQPLGGKAQFGGQRFGEMEVWALEAYGAAHTLQEMLTIKSDDVPGRSKAYEAIIKGEKITRVNLPESFNVLVRELKGLALDVELLAKNEAGDYVPAEELEAERQRAREERRGTPIFMTRDQMPGTDFDALRLRVASPEVIHHWSYGEVNKPETINYRTQKPEKGGLFAEEIFGPTKDWECYCGKYKKIRYKGIICDKCGVEVTHSLVRRQRMGHIELSSPVTHIWFLRSIPSKIGLILDLSIQAMEKVIYFAAFIVTKVNEDGKKQAHDLLRQEYKNKKKQINKEFENQVAQANNEKQGRAALEEIAKERDRKFLALEDDFKAAEEDLKDLQMLKIVSENRYQELALRFGHLFDAEIGAEAVRHLLEKLNLPETIKNLEAEINRAKGAKRDRFVRRVKLLKSLHHNGIRPEWMVLTAIPVVPPDLRPMVALDGGRFATSDLNDLYRRVINRNNRLKRLLELNAPEVICRNEKRMLQEAVDALIDNNARAAKTVTASTGQKRQLRSLADILKGKQGRFRQNLLGKRVDYSGRSVIVVGPRLNISECGIPKRMALELFKPFIMAEIIKRELAHNVRSASRFIESNAPEVWDILEELTKKTRVLLNRAPTLHRLGIQAFRPHLIEGKAIRLHPLVCPAFNADFDGDQMAVHLPLTEEAKWEAENLMAAEKNLLKPATGAPVTTPQQDIALGSYYLTKYREDDTGEVKKFFTDVKEAKYAYQTRRIHLKERIKVRFDNLSKFPQNQDKVVETSVGRIFFNEVLPDKLPYYNETVTKKHLGQIIQLSLELYGQEETAKALDKMKILGFKYVTKSGYSLGMDDFGKIEGKPAILKEGDDQVQAIYEQYREGLLTNSERHAKTLEVWTQIKDKVVSFNKQALDKDGSVFAMIDSGARGSWGQLGQVVGMKGLVASPSGEIIELPVKGNFKEGFDVLEFFISSHGTRKGLSDTALRTANAGYLTRRLVDVAQDVVVRAEDCGDDEGETFTRAQSEEMGEKLSERVLGRFTLAEIKSGRKIIVKAGELVTENIARRIEEEKVEAVQVRSVMKCKLGKGLCQKCYGYDLAHNKLVASGTAVGIIAAQSIGEPGTQLTMRTFHLGGIAGGGDITQGLPRVEELFEARNPKRRAVLTEVEGTVEIEDADGKVITGPTGRKIFEGRRGQKIIRVHFEGLDEMKFKIHAEDEMQVKDNQKVKAGDILLVRGSSGEEIKAKYAGTIRQEDKAIFLIYEGRHVKEYIIPLGYKLWIKNGDQVSKGDQLTEGSVNLQELYELKGKEAVQRYLLTEIKGIYAAQGQRLNDKHVEIIIKQMFSRIYIEDPGETDLLPGEVVEKAQLILANELAKKEGKKEASGRELFMGISKVSLSTQSFLSAASFQETARVLINAAITGKIDQLGGLKENVIIGRLIPAGTGYKP